MRNPTPDELKELTPFGVNEVRLNLKQWWFVLGLMTIIFLLTPPVWAKLEHFKHPLDYRIPYALSKDYALYTRHLKLASSQTDHPVFVVGDSVVWGEYVSRDGTLSSFLSAQSSRQFVNAGINGLFPLAIEGLMKNYSGSLRKEKVILHFNLLWLSSPKADLSTTKEETFNHTLLVRQFRPRIPCYKASLDDRISIVLQRSSDFLSWGNHLKYAYFDGRDLLGWTLATDSADRLVNASKNPLAQITLKIPEEPENDPSRGINSPRHKAWSTNSAPGTQEFEWVALEKSLQWQAFQRACETLVSRGNSLFIIIGPFNEHMMSAANRAQFTRLKNEATAWCQRTKLPVVTPDPLPSELYADASHPLTQGYKKLAEELLRDNEFRSWLQK